MNIVFLIGTAGVPGGTAGAAQVAATAAEPQLNGGGKAVDSPKEKPSAMPSVSMASLLTLATKVARVELDVVGEEGLPCVVFASFTPKCMELIVVLW